MLDVVHVGLHALGHGLLVGVAMQAAGLGQTRDSGAHPVADSVAPNRVGIALRVARHVGPRTNQAHVSAQHVPKLGQLVEMASAKPWMKYPRIARNRLKVGIRLTVHAAELPNGKLLAPVAIARLRKKYGSAASKANPEGNQGHQWCQDYQCDCGTQHVKDPLHRGRPTRSQGLKAPIQ